MFPSFICLTTKQKQIDHLKVRESISLCLWEVMSFVAPKRVKSTVHVNDLSISAFVCYLIIKKRSETTESRSFLLLAGDPRRKIRVQRNCCVTKQLREKMFFARERWNFETSLRFGLFASSFFSSPIDSESWTVPLTHSQCRSSCARWLISPSPRPKKISQRVV